MSSIPLTTVFAPPPGCTTHWTYRYSCSVCTTSTTLEQWLDAAGGQPWTSTCFPSGYTASGTSVSAFSPGYVCPLGYTTADVQVSGSVTTAACCSSGFDYISAFCQKSYSTSTYVTLLSTGLFVEAADVASVGPGIALAHPVKIAYDNEQRLLFIPSITAGPITPSRSTTSRSVRPATKSSPLASAGPAVSSTSSASGSASSSLSTGAKAGIGVGVVIAALLILCAAMLFCILRRRRHSRVADVAEESEHVKEEPDATANLLLGELKY